MAETAAGITACFQGVEQTADWGLDARAPTLAQVFEAAARGQLGLTCTRRAGKNR